MDLECELQIAFSVFAGITAIVGEVWYNYSIYCNRTRPDRLAWWMLSLSSVMFTSSHLVLGGIWTAIVPIIITIGEIVTSILSLSRGTKLKITELDIAALAIALFSLFIWWLFHEPRVALFANLTVSTVGMAMCIRKAYRVAASEAVGPWLITVLADTLNMFAIGQGSLEWLVPSQFLAVDGVMLVTVIYRMDHNAGMVGKLYKSLRWSSLTMHHSSC